MGFENYEPVIGLEIHAQLNTASKIFCSCSTDFSKGDNENTCPVCLGMPGTLPVLNEDVVTKAVKVGLSLGCEINDGSFFERKNYFYPDLSKGYQISQLEVPINGRGNLSFYVDDKKKTVGITRAHLEEDAGKSVHQGDSTLLNYNRAGIPLVEIVSEPDLRTPREAAEYAREIRKILTFIGVNDGNLEEGSLRCDCNVSVRRKGDTKFGIRTELKNINSFRFIEKAIQYEIERQVDLIESGAKIIQETRLYDSTKNKTFSMRTKEEAEDYRYFPDPDLQPIRIDSDWVKELKSSLPELPTPRLERFVNSFGLLIEDAKLLTSQKETADFFETVIEICEDPKLASSWLLNELLGRLNERGEQLQASKVTADRLGGLLRLISGGKVSGKMAKRILDEMLLSDDSPESIISRLGLEQISDEKEIEKMVSELFKAHPAQFQELLDGKQKVVGFFVGLVMKQTKGQANPQVVNRAISHLLDLERN